MEGDSDLIFSCGNRIDQLFDSYDNDSLPSMPSTEALFKKALEWTVEMGMIRPIVPAEQLTVVIITQLITSYDSNFMPLVGFKHAVDDRI
jgi:hypothetical protein